jgi:dTDP-4-dehydrorhamnose reductase
MRVAVLGARGQLGAAVVHEFSAGHDVVAFDRAALDITDPRRVAEAMDRVRPDAIVNCAAYNAVDAAEDNHVLALAVNAFAVRSLARAARACGALLVHYSTDFVFDGRATRPYTEEDAPNPLSVYGASKLLGEWFATDVERHYVLRVEGLFGSVPGGPPPRGSVAAILDALRAGQPARVFEDRTVTPTFVRDAAGATRALIERRHPSGLYHCVNSGTCTWAEFGREIVRTLGIAGTLEPVRMTDVPMRAVRPLYCAMDNRKLASCGISMPDWHDAVRRHLASDLAASRLTDS